MSGFLPFLIPCSNKLFLGDFWSPTFLGFINILKRLSPWACLLSVSFQSKKHTVPTVFNAMGVPPLLGDTGPLNTWWYISQKYNNTLSRLPLFSEQRLHTYINEFLISSQIKQPSLFDLQSLYLHITRHIWLYTAKINTNSQCAANSEKYNIKNKQFHKRIFEHKSNQYLIKLDIITASFKGIQI